MILRSERGLGCSVGQALREPVGLAIWLANAFSVGVTYGLAILSRGDVRVAKRGTADPWKNEDIVLAKYGSNPRGSGTVLRLNRASFGAI